MSADVVKLVPPSLGDGAIVPPDQILEVAAGKYAMLTLVGQTPEGEIEVCGSHPAGDSMILLAWAQNFIVQNICDRR